VAYEAGEGEWFVGRKEVGGGSEKV